MEISINKIKKIMLYAGLEKEEYDYIQEGFTKINQVNLNGLAMITAGYMFVMIILSFRNDISAANRAHFIWCLCSCIGVIFAAIFGLFKTRVGTLIGIYWYLNTIFAYGIAIGSTQASQTAVSFLIFIMVGPLLFFDRPIRLNGFMWLFNIIFLVVSMQIKSPTAGETDLINGLSYGLISCFLNTATMGMKMKFVLLEKKMHIMAETDTLTNLKNRNCFEQHYQDYVKQAKKSVTCIYIDVNGLHEMNNLQGHEAGDQMLKYLAEQIMLLFGWDDVYRLGGDEYMVFCCDEDEEIIKQKIEALAERMNEKQYSVSTGVATALIEGLIMNELIKMADQEMYLCKKKFYAQKKYDRRRSDSRKVPN